MRRPDCLPKPLLDRNRFRTHQFLDTDEELGICSTPGDGRSLDLLHQGLQGMAGRYLIGADQLFCVPILKPPVKDPDCRISESLTKPRPELMDQCTIVGCRSAGNIQR